MKLWSLFQADLHLPVDVNILRGLTNFNYYSRGLLVHWKSKEDIPLKLTTHKFCIPVCTGRVGYSRLIENIADPLGLPRALQSLTRIVIQ